MQAVVQKWGNSLGFRIPSLWAKDNNVKNGSKIEVIAEKGNQHLPEMSCAALTKNQHSFKTHWQ